MTFRARCRKGKLVPCDVLAQAGVWVIHEPLSEGGDLVLAHGPSGCRLFSLPARPKIRRHEALSGVVAILGNDWGKDAKTLVATQKELKKRGDRPVIVSYMTALRDKVNR